MATNLSTYEAAVEHLASAKENFDFPNKDNNHASIVISALIKYSQEVRFFVKNLDGSIADIKDSTNESRFINALREFLSIGKCMKIVVKEKMEPKDEEQSEIFKFLKGAINDYSTLDVRYTSTSFASNQQNGLSVKNEGDVKDFYYMVGDKSSYRINFDRDNHKAICNFNNEPVASILVKNFDNHFLTCKKAFND